MGYWLRCYGFPLAPMVLGILVGGIADTSLRRALQTFQGDYTTMLTQPIAMVLLVILLYTIASQLQGLFVKGKSN